MWIMRRLPPQLGAATGVHALAIAMIAHSQLGNAYGYFFDTHDLALEHWYKAIKFAEAIGDVLRAAGIRNNVASILCDRGQHADAREYIQSVLTSLDQAGIDADANGSASLRKNWMSGCSSERRSSFH
jgi:tetratricopeptide (TPR) repeat protein